MAKKHTGIPDALLLALLSDKEKLSDELLITPAQLGLIMGGRSDDQLGDDRQKGLPPKFVKPWGENGQARYKLGTVRAHLAAVCAEYENNEVVKAAFDAQRTRAIGFATTFPQWLDTAKASDEWPFLIRKTGIPVDFIKALSLPDLSDDEPCLWLTLDEYLIARQKAGIAAQTLFDSVELEGAANHGKTEERKTL